MLTVAAFLLSVALFVQPGPVCTIGSGANAWSGSPADLAQIQAVHERDQAEAAGREFPHGGPRPSPWSGLVRCSASS